MASKDKIQNYLSFSIYKGDKTEHLLQTLDDSDGVYIWETRAWDAARNAGVSPALLLRVKNNPNPPPLDLTLPVVQWVSPEPGSELSGEVELRFQVIDETGLDSVKVYLNGQEWQKLLDIIQSVMPLAQQE